MNIKLSVYTNRVAGLSGYLVCKSGDILDINVSKLYSQNIKEDILEKLTRGLRACRNIVSHNDILYIEVQNQHLCNWLDGKVEYKGYSSGLDSVFEVLETLDCRYRFLFVKEPIAKPYVQKGKTEMSVQSIAEAFADFN